MLRKVFNVGNAVSAVQLIAMISVTFVEARNWNIAVSEVKPGYSIVNGNYRIPIIENSQASVEGNVHASGAIGGDNSGHMSLGSTLSGRHRPSGIAGTINANPSFSGSGTTVSGRANFPIAQAPDGYISGNVHGSRVFGRHMSRMSGSYGAGLTYGLHKGIYGGVDVTNSGMGNTYSANIGAGRKLGAGIFSLTGAVQKRPHSDDLDGQIWIQFQFPFSF
ncbi:uncharacterized protein LOC124355461 [Homalodisca vitripennis]|uniref:uncharacterized protein LOC124355461 n=1 Tax=Homalodisca vitripennis TaxID=197043 RepID=UPI001EEB1488|nr:uncharacterized protein LOC124355461 [Homalodisca vitripennis]KAG8275750.1 hypothetical protein J6590_079951 [Homalodisca vitripennis]